MRRGGGSAAVWQQQEERRWGAPNARTPLRPSLALLLLTGSHPLAYLPHCLAGCSTSSTSGSEAQTALRNVGGGRGHLRQWQRATARLEALGGRCQGYCVGSNQDSIAPRVAYCQVMV